MAEQYTPNLGQTPGDDARRDAIHLAVVPVVTRFSQAPGRRVGLTGRRVGNDYEVDTCVGEPVGILDPYRQGEVPAGGRCWLFLFPGTITGLRHVWSHPAFAVQVPQLVKEEPR